jgi:hypothetical protein
MTGGDADGSGGESGADDGGPRELMRKTTGSEYVGMGDYMQTLKRVVVDGGAVKIQEAERLALDNDEPDWETVETVETEGDNDND